MIAPLGRPARRRRWRRIALWSLACCVTAALGLIVAAHLWIVLATREYVYDDIRQVPGNEVGLVLGVSRYSSSGRPSAPFMDRVEAAADLYRRGRVRRVLPSGAGNTSPYDQVLDMRQALAQLGVPPSDIILDNAGDRTLDSVVRAKKVFGLRRVTLVTQRFHAYRSVYLARHYGLDAVAYCARTSGPAWRRVTWAVREFLAQVKALLDLYVLHTEPIHPLTTEGPVRR